jgi:Ca2+-binding RTX toxin-like protein
LTHQLPVAINKEQGAIERINLTGNSLGNTIDASQALGREQISLSGREGNDNIIGSQGRDVISGNDGADTLVGGGGFNTLDGDDDNDTLIGGNDDNIFEGGAGNDVVQGGTGRDTFADSISDGAGDDRYIGGEGDDDFLSVNGGGQSSSENIIFELGSSLSNPDNSTLRGGKLIQPIDPFEPPIFVDSATGTDTLEGIDSVQIDATAGFNFIDARSFNGDVILRGFGGNDRLIGGRGNDILDGGGLNGDSDTLTGGNAFNGVGSADTFQIGSGYRGFVGGHAVITDFSVQDGDKLSLRFLAQESASVFTFTQQNFNSGGSNSPSILDTVVRLNAPFADLITVLEDVSVNASTPGVEISG